MAADGDRYLTTLRVSILTLLLLAAGSNTVLTIHQLFFAERAYTGMTAVRSADGMTVGTVQERDEDGRPAPAARAGVLPGDRIDAIFDAEGRGGPIGGVFDYGDRIRMMAPGVEYSLMVYRRSDSGPPSRLVLNLTPEAMRSPPLTFRILVSYLGVFVWVPILMIIAGTLVGFLRPGDSNAFLAGVLFFAFASVFHFSLVFFPPGWREVLAIYRMTVPAFASFFFLLFFLRFPFPSPLERKAPWLKYAGFGLLLLIETYRSLFDLTAYFSFDLHLRYLQATAGQTWAAALDRLYFPVTCALYFLGIVSLALNEGEARTPQDVRRLSLIGGGSAGLVSLFILGLLIQLGIEAPTWLLVATSVLVGLFPLSFVYAVIKHRVFGIRFILRRGLQYALISRGFLALEALLIFIALFFLAGPLFGPLFPGAAQNLAPVATAALTLALVAGLRRVNQQVMPVIDRRFFRDAYDARQILTELSRSIRMAPSQPDLLLNTVCERIQHTLHPLKLTIFLCDEDWPDLEPEPALAESRLHIQRRGGAETYLPFLFRSEGSSPAAALRSIAARIEETLPAGTRMSRFFDRLSEERDPGVLEIRPKLRRGLTLSSSDDWSALLQEENPDSTLLGRFEVRLIVPLVTGGDVLGFIALGEKRSEEPYSAEDRELLLTVAEQVAIALDHGRLIGQVTEQEKLQRELEIAQEVQARLFPQRAPELETLEIAGDCLQAREVGGDYFDFIEFGKGWVGLVLADIAGKGISAALLMASLQANLRSHYPVALESLQKLVMQVNRQFCQAISSNRFATFFFGIYHDDTRHLRYVNCGHQAPIIIRAGGTVERLEATGTVLGAFEEWQGSVAGIRLKPADTLVLFSDGVTEALSDHGEEFGDERLVGRLGALKDLPVDEVLETLIDELTDFTGREQEDDITLVIARGRDRKRREEGTDGPGAAPGTPVGGGGA